MCESGKFYGTLVDPILKPMRKHVAREIKSKESVIDIACGTGAQVFELAKKASSVVGVDYSDSMLGFAKEQALKHHFENIEFIAGDATNLASIKKDSFDVATMTLALHQFDPDLHKPILNEMKRVARKIIIVDYAVPLPLNYLGIGSRVAEFLAGKEHNRNFKSYYKLGGLDKILTQNGLLIQKSRFFAKGAFQLVICSEGEE
jgi:ubiquinone/menaquinone biosynthesis C-methylase UbiE